MLVFKNYASLEILYFFLPTVNIKAVLNPVDTISTEVK